MSSLKQCPELSYRHLSVSLSVVWPVCAIYRFANSFYHWMSLKIAQQIKATILRNCTILCSYVQCLRTDPRRNSRTSSNPVGFDKTQPNPHLSYNFHGQRMLLLIVRELQVRLQQTDREHCVIPPFIERATLQSLKNVEHCAAINILHPYWISVIFTWIPYNVFGP